MGALDTIRDMLLTFAKSIMGRSRPTEFSCGDCNQRDRCGLPPHRDCVVMAEQLALDGGRPLRRVTPVLY
jgi:hypothetical protein